jgi:hypothetical protein
MEKQAGDDAWRWKRKRQVMVVARRRSFGDAWRNSGAAPSAPGGSFPSGMLANELAQAQLRRLLEVVGSYEDASKKVNYHRRKPCDCDYCRDNGDHSQTRW